MSTEPIGSAAEFFQVLRAADPTDPDVSDAFIGPGGGDETVEHVVTYMHDDANPRYVRSAAMWRRPIVHLLNRQSYTLERFRGRVYRLDSYATMCLGGSVYHEADTYEALPDGLTVCQRCVERLAFESQRQRQRRAPDPDAYARRTAGILAFVEEDKRVIAEAGGRSEDAGADLREAA